MTQAATNLVPVNAPVISAPTEPGVRLDLGCGQTPKEGFEGVDKHAQNAKHKVDLFKFPYPWADNSVDEIHCSHFAEHIPAREVEPRDLVEPERIDFVGRDMLYAFMDECHRILKPGAKMLIVVPNARSNRGFQDPTHRRFFVAETFAYFTKEWRDANKLDHYLGQCNFGANVVPIVRSEETLRNEQVQQQRYNECWNTVLDWHATLIKKETP